MTITATGALSPDTGTVPVFPFSMFGERRDYVFLTHGQVLTLAAEAGSWRLLIPVPGYTGPCWSEATAQSSANCQDMVDRARHERDGRNLVNRGRRRRLRTASTVCRGS